MLASSGNRSCDLVGEPPSFIRAIEALRWYRDDAACLCDKLMILKAVSVTYVSVACLDHRYPKYIKISHGALGHAYLISCFLDRWEARIGRQKKKKKKRKEKL